MGFGPKFVRTWDYYFAYCAAGFQTRTIGDLQVRNTPGRPKASPLLKTCGAIALDTSLRRYSQVLCRSVSAAAPACARPPPLRLSRCRSSPAR